MRRDGEPAPDRYGERTPLRLELEYDGTGFAGWAAQPALRTVEGTLRSALDGVFPRWGGLAVAGRTDAGVHALGQVASVEVAGLRGPVRRAEAGKLRVPKPWELFDGPKAWATEARLSKLPFVQGVRSRLKSPGGDNHQVRLIFEVVEGSGY